MIPTLNPVTTGRGVPFLEFIDAASDAGFPAVEYSIVPFAEYAKSTSVNGLQDLLAEKRLRLGSFGLPVEFRKDEATFKEQLAELPSYIELARELGVTKCCTWLFPATDEPVAEYTSRFIRRLRECAKALEAGGIQFGIEWVGPKTLRTLKHDFIHTIPGALELIGAIDVPGVGLLFDSFHWFTSRATVDDILQLRKEQVVLVHLNDAPDLPADEQIDNQRLLPGEGIINLGAMLTALRQIGYHEYVSVETFSDTLPLLGAKEAALRTKQVVDRVLAVGSERA
ncbi:sugar phosphate isomerase/epimerase family protein [Paenibacillus cremeus]|uniref:Sugar phosphate isomerase/epimerase n=1 Tax=Paenibacillus cremeus TaxID=2163881 RepID=A0A559JHP6_9BACL|nr:sugar phosphate isomerase/epimerase family protein [Paenibacillus cremeus]TVX99386.1 sugar phosphate isomerase/epimerase [Paenibacillus cremeus]